MPVESKEFDTIVRTVCGEALGANVIFARKLGTTPATISRWRNGVVTISARDSKLLRLIAYLHKRRIGWEKISNKPVESIDSLL